jgi:hypothetical protein
MSRTGFIAEQCVLPELAVSHAFFWRAKTEEEKRAQVIVKQSHVTLPLASFNILVC